MRARRAAAPVGPGRGRRRPRFLMGLTAVLTFLLSSLAGTSPAAAYQSPAIWVGSPVSGTWGMPGDASTTPSGGHHKLYKASPQNDWSVDLPTGAGTAAYLY